MKHSTLSILALFALYQLSDGRPEVRFENEEILPEGELIDDYPFDLKESVVEVQPEIQDDSRERAHLTGQDSDA